MHCEWEDHDSPSRCEGELRHYLHFDIFSDQPKGILTLCEYHDGYYGNPTEGYFTCVDCERVHISNITWEVYSVATENGDVCIPCYLKRVLDGEKHWIQLTDEAINAVDFNRVRKAPHCIAVQMPIPPNTIRFVNNVEFDSMDGHCISGSGVEELKDTLHQLKDEGVDRALLILDGAYQFAVSIAVYAPVTSGVYDKKAVTT